MLRHLLIATLIACVSTILAQPTAPSAPFTPVPCNTTCDCGQFGGGDSGDIGFVCTDCVSGFCEVTAQCPEGELCYNNAGNGSCTAEVEDLILCNTTADCNQTLQCSQCIHVDVGNVSFCRTLFECSGNCNIDACECEDAPSETPVETPSATPDITPAQSTAVISTTVVVAVAFLALTGVLIYRCRGVSSIRGGEDAQSLTAGAF